MAEDPLIGMEIGGCELEVLLGQGGMSRIYRALQKSTGRLVAVKLLSAGLAGDPHFEERFTREVETTAKLQHPNIITLHDHGMFDGLPYIIMAYIAGGSLEDRLKKRGVLAIEKAAHYITHIASALDYAHEHGFIHRDIKPGNVLIDEGNDRAILSDFGIARALAGTTHITADSIVGTAAYLPPEIVQLDVDYTPALDVYGLGAMLFRMLAGRLPHEADNVMQMLWAHVNNPLPDITDISSNLPPSLNLLLHKAMAKRPTDRYASAGELAADLAQIAAGQRPPTADRFPPPTRILDPVQVGGRMEDAVARVLDQVVKIMRPDGGSGSGIVVEGGQVITSLHVVDGSPGIYVQFRSGEQIEAEVIAADRVNDLGLLRLRATPETVDINTQRALRLEFNRLEPGERLSAIGHPLGLDWSVTGGHYNGLRYPGDEALVRFGIQLKVPLVQVDVSINPGNSGGPLIDSEGGLVGLAVSIINPAVVNNIGFAVHGPAVVDFWRVNRENSEALIPYSDGRHHEPGLTYSPSTGKPIRPVPRIPMITDLDAAVRCSGCGTLFAGEALYCPYCGKPNPAPVVVE